MIQHVIEARKTHVAGFEVGRVLPFAKHRAVGPFVFLDHMGPAPSPPEGLQVPPHPHIGLSTLTYLFEGDVFHRDSLGSAQPIRPGEVNWMTAGRGIVHSERGTGPLHGLQAWVALPEADEETDPRFDHHDTTSLPVHEADGVWSRLVAGSAYGVTAPTRVFSPLFYLHLELAAGARGVLPAEHDERAIYVVAGEVEVDGTRFGPGRLVVFGPGDAAFDAIRPTTAVALGGANLGPRFIWWNFVSSSQARIEQAKADWAAGRFVLPPGDDRERVAAPATRD